MTYNVLHSPPPGTKEGTETVPSWPQRRTPMLALIKKANPMSWPAGGQRLGRRGQGTQGRRRPGRPARGLHRGPHGGHPRTAGLVPNSPLHPVPHRDVPRRWRRRALGPAPGQVRRLPGAAEPHRPAPGSWPCRCTCPRRRAHGRPGPAGRDPEAAQLRPRPSRPSAQVPVIYLGDFNSHEGHALDGPGVALRATGVADADEVAQALATAVQQREPVLPEPRTGTGTSTTFTPPPVWPSGAGPWGST